MRNIFSESYPIDKLSPEELKLKEYFTMELLTATSKGGCPGCVRTRLLNKYNKKLHRLVEAKRRGSQGNVSP